MQRLDPESYAVDPSVGLSTPRLLVFREHVEKNISLLREHLERVVAGSGFRHLSTHVKTHKSAWVTELLRKRGIERFKCTPRELDMLLESGAEDIFVAYPLLPHEADRVASSAARHPGVRLTAQIAAPIHAEWLAAAGKRHGVEIDCLIDIDVGNHRTGIRPDRAPDLARHVLASPRLSPVRIRGLHAYDGHNNSPDACERAAVAERAMGEVVECARAVEKAGVRVERIVAGGTPAFLHDLAELVNRHRVGAEVHVSPGTWIYWDSNYEAKMPGLFEYAALILAQVMDLPGDGLATLNLGHKRWAIDQGPVQVFSEPGVEVASTSEEHTVLRLTPGKRLEIGDRVLIVPRHVCSTVNLWERFTVIGGDGRVEEEDLPVSARNR
jgi:D-serine deaminase-like pyridoxal phosphate-dependent protein